MSTARSLVEVKVLGLLKHRKEKICMLAVTWSDQNSVLIYRAFEEFKTLHKELKKKFPIQSGLLKKSDRTIPTFRDLKVMLRKRQKLSNCTDSLKLLDTYCQGLLKTEFKISQGEDVVNFFEARERDLDPAFSENSIVILPSERGDRKTEKPVRSFYPTIQPIVCQNYRCVADCETNDVKDRPFKVTRGEVLEVIVKDRTGWWLVENERKQIAWFPGPYLEVPEVTPGAQESNERDDSGTLYYVTQTTMAKRPDELSVNAGIVVNVLEKPDNGWWFVWYNGTAGYVPSMFLQPYRNPHCRLLALAGHGLYVSTPNLPGAFFSPNSSSSQRCGSWEDIAQGHSRMRMGEGDVWSSKTAPCSLSGAGDIASCGLTPERNNLCDGLKNVMEEGFDRPHNSEVKWLGSHRFIDTQHYSSRSQGSLSPLLETIQCDSGLEEEALGYSNSSFSSLDAQPSPSGPRIPPRPLPHEILQKCSALTRTALERSLGHGASSLQPCTAMQSRQGVTATGPCKF